MGLPDRLSHHPATAWGVLAFSLLLTTLAWQGADQIVARRTHDRFQFQSEAIKEVLLDRMRDYQVVLRGGTGLYRASQSVERGEWRRYVESIDIQHLYPGIQGLGFSQVIPAGELARHEAAVRAEGFPEYRVKPAGARPLYTAIVYLEPFDWRNQRAFGYDMFSEPVRRAAMEHARDSGEAAVSGLVRLVQETDRDVQNGVLMYLPVYRNGLPTTTVDQRRAALAGYVYSPFRMKDLMRGIIGPNLPYLDFLLYDGTTPVKDNLLYTTRPEAAGSVDSRMTRDMRMEVGGRAWTLVVHDRPGYVPSAEARLPAIFALGGLISSLLLFLYIRTLAGQQRRAEDLAREMTDELRNSEERNRTLVEFAPDAIIVIDERGLILECNPAALQFFGYRGDDLLGTNVSRLMPSPDQENHDGYLARYLETGTAHVIGCGRDVEARRNDGSLVTIHLRVSEQRRADGSRRFIGFIRDLSERVRVESALRERDALFRNVISTSVDGFWIIDLEGRILEINDAYCRLSGYSREELLGMKVSDLEAIEHPDAVDEHIANIKARGGDLFETLHRAKDGRVWPLEVSVTFSAKPQGRLIAFCRDISERKRYEAELENHRQHLEEQVALRTTELREAEHRTRMILESSADGLYGIDVAGRFTFANPAACTLLGYRPGELEGRPVHECIHHSHPDGSPYVGEDCALSRELLRGNALRVEHDVYWRRDGQALHVSVASQPMWHDGEIIGAVVSFTDIHERLEAESALRRQAEELREQYDALEKFNRIMVGRELDMIRLKRQVNELALRLGEAPPYDLSFADATALGTKP